MSDEVAVRLKDVSKSYVVYTDPKYWLADFVGLGRLLREEKHYRSLWALRDINLEIPKGGKFALVGRNGAGKSTLLRIISENIAPTTGTVEVSGHCEALMQLGAGFNPEFTGRQNVFSALAYMGITGKTAEEKFWDIVDFSELDEFMEQPVRTYSSGMYVRLAFSVATVIAPEILIIDEILSAGDLYFQAKCLGRIKELTSGPGTTVIYVSHDFESAQRICDTFVWLDRGRIVAQGSSAEVRAAYEDSIRKQQELRMRSRNLRLNPRTVSTLQAAGEEGLHLLGQLTLQGDDLKVPGPHVSSLRLYVRGGLAEEVRVGDALDDNSSHYRSFVISGAADGTWSPPQRREERLTRAVRPASNGVSGARFALFVPHDDFTDPDFQLELEVAYQDSSRVPCHLEVHTGVAGLKELVSLEHTGDGQWKTARTVVPRWVYAPTTTVEPPAERLSPAKRFGTGQVLIESVQFLNGEGQPTFVLQHGRPLRIVLTYRAEDPSVIGTPLTWASGFHALDRTQIMAMISSAQGISYKVCARGRLTMRFERLLLCNGAYRFSTALFSKLDLHGYSQHFTSNPDLYDMMASSFELLVEGAAPAESWIFRHPVAWESAG
jgi:lipopolysaccharide transport system ATP-binding protein